MSEMNPYSAPGTDARRIDGLKRIPFTPDDEKTIGATATLMTVAAAASIISGLLVLVSNLIRGDFGQIFGNLIGASVSILMGVWIFSAAGSFKKVVQTDEDFSSLGFCLVIEQNARENAIIHCTPSPAWQFFQPDVG